MRAQCLGLSLFLAATFAGSAAPAQASIVLDLTGGSALPAFAGTAGTAGWAIQVHTSITVEGLGIWDEGSNGLSAPHNVGIWTSGGSLLRSATVGNAGTKVPSFSGLGQWIFAQVSPLFLTPGEYVLGAFYQANDPDSVRVLTNVSTISQISFLTAQTISSPGALAFPSQSDTAQNDGVFGPNLFVASATSEGPVPEPAALVVWCLGGGAALAVTLWRRAPR